MEPWGAMTFLVNQCCVVYRNGSPFENDETFQIHQLLAVGRSRRHGVYPRELRDLFESERKTPTFYAIYQRRRPASECGNGNR